MILLKTLQLNNFLSHEDTKIDFTSSEKLLVDGKSGGGKSSITEGILWCLYGKGRVDNRSLVRRGTKTATVSLQLSDGPSIFIITRSVSSTGKNTLTITKNSGKSGQFLPIERVGLKDLQDWIEGKFLRSSYELFTNSVAYPQDNEASFVKASASKRKDLLLEIVGAKGFDDLYEKARLALSDNQLESALTSNEIKNAEETISKSKELADKYDFFKEQEEKSSVTIDSFKLTERDLEAKINNISSISNDLANNKRIRSMLINSIDKIDVQLSDDQKLITEHNNLNINSARNDVLGLEKLTIEENTLQQELENNSIAQQKVNAHLANRPSVFDYSVEIAEINKRLIILMKDVGKCPAGDKCPFIVPIKGQIDYLTEQLTEKSVKSINEQDAMRLWEQKLSSLPPIKDTSVLYLKQKELREKISVLSRSKEVITKYDSFTQTLDEINARKVKLESDKMEFKENLNQTDMKIKELEDIINTFDVNRVNSDLANLRIMIQQVQKAKEEATLNVSLALTAQNTIKEASDALLRLQNTIKKGNEDKESLELLKEAFSPRGIRAVVVDYIIPQLESKINDILSQLSDFRIRLDTQQAKLSEEEGVKEGLFLTVINDCGEEMSYQNYSGGEKNRITIAISEGLASLTSIMGFRIMDEMIVGLNAEMIIDFVEILLKLQEKYPQVICISHIPEVKEVFEKVITITKVNGISKIN